MSELSSVRLDAKLKAQIKGSSYTDLAPVSFYNFKNTNVGKRLMLEPADQGADLRELRFSQNPPAAWEKISGADGENLQQCRRISPVAPENFSGGTREAGNKPCIIVVVAV